MVVCIQAPALEVPHNNGGNIIYRRPNWNEKDSNNAQDFAANPEMSIDEYAKEQNISRTTVYERISDRHTRLDIKGTGGL